MGSSSTPETRPTYGMKANPLGTAGNLGHQHLLLCPRGQEGALSHPTIPRAPAGDFPGLVSSPGLGDIPGGSSTPDEALIIELIGVTELYRQSQFPTHSLAGGEGQRKTGMKGWGGGGEQEGGGFGGATGRAPNSCHCG